MTKDEYIIPPEPIINYQYGILTIVYDTTDPGFDDVWRYLGYEHITPKDKMVVEFKSTKHVYDTDLIDVGDTIQCSVVFSTSVFPACIMHRKPGNPKNLYFYSVPNRSFLFNKYNDKNLCKVFDKMPEYENWEASKFNGTYTYTPKYRNGPRPAEQIAFGTLKLKPTKNTCRILFAYNPDVLNEKESVYIMKSIIENAYNN